MPPRRPTPHAARSLLRVASAALLLGLGACDLDTLFPGSAAADVRMEPTGPPLTVQDSPLPPATVGGVYDVALRASGGSGSFTWTVESGSLPPGLTLGDTGRIQGAPTSSGRFGFTVAVNSGGRRTTASFTLDVVPNATDSYEVTLVELTALRPNFEPHVDAALARWEEVVVGDLPPATIPPDFFGTEACGGKAEVLNGTTVEDVAILLEVDSIDGVGQVVGRAGPCALRDSGLPLVGTLTLDSHDMFHLVGTERLTDLIIHEIGHVLGFGSLWTRMELVEESGTDDPRFTGSRAVEALGSLGGEGKVPLEAEGGEGTRESHWRESTFDSEIMTGFNERQGVPQPLSAVTIGSMADLGYRVDMDAADPYALPASTSAVAPASDRVEGTYDVVLRGPVRVLLPDGRGVTVRLPEPR